MKKLQRRFAPTPAALPWNQWPVCSGIPGRFQRNTHLQRNVPQSQERPPNGDRRRQALFLDHFVRFDQHVLWYYNTNLLRRLQVDEDIKF
jgi:hypothetical protein